MSKDLILSIILISLILLTVKSIISLNDSKKRINRAKLEIKENEMLKDSLTRKVEKAKTPEYIDKLAIEKLNMTKDGYKIVIDNSRDEPIYTSNESDNNETLPNWKLWKQKLNL